MNCCFHWKIGDCFQDGHDKTTTWHKAYYTHKLTLTHKTLEWQTHPKQFQQQDLMFCNALLPCTLVQWHNIINKVHIFHDMFISNCTCFGLTTIFKITPVSYDTRINLYAYHPVVLTNDYVYIFSLTHCKILYNHLIPLHAYYMFWSIPRPSSFMSIQRFTQER
jgi:hypothetical protein